MPYVTYINSGAAATALARWILDNVADDPSAPGVEIFQHPESITVASDLSAADISLDGEVDEN